MTDSFLHEMFESNTTGCFDYSGCNFKSFAPCISNFTHDHRYEDASASWVLISAIIVFFMKAGFMLIELAFAQNVREKKHVVVLKHLDVFASAFGFFWLGFSVVSDYVEEIPEFYWITSPTVWFFKFTFASNAATIVGGCLVTNKYKLRLPAAFMSSFVISGITHPLIARLIWSHTRHYSVYRFCHSYNGSSPCTYTSFSDKMYILDFAGGGAVHLVGGMAGLVLCLFAKLSKYLENRNLRCKNKTYERIIEGNEDARRKSKEEPEKMLTRNFWEWMYPVDGGGETTSEAALGVLILWFSWFAFNCGSTESIESVNRSVSKMAGLSYHDIPSIIAINMIMAASSGGVVAVIIASLAQLQSQAESVNANEIANGVLSALVAITAGCPFVDYWAACIIGGIAVIVYHIGCWLEYRLGIEDTARVVPVHGLCGLWSLLAVGFFIIKGDQSSCNLHATFEGLCYCYLRLPKLNQGERIGAQLIGGILMISITIGISSVLYGILFMIPMCQMINKCMSRFFKIVFRVDVVVHLEGNWLFTGPKEIPHLGMDYLPAMRRSNESTGLLSETPDNHNDYHANSSVGDSRRRPRRKEANRSDNVSDSSRHRQQRGEAINRNNSNSSHDNQKELSVEVIFEATPLVTNVAYSNSQQKEQAGSSSHLHSRSRRDKDEDDAETHTYQTCNDKIVK